MFSRIGLAMIILASPRVLHRPPLRSLARSATAVAAARRDATAETRSSVQDTRWHNAEACAPKLFRGVHAEKSGRTKDVILRQSASGGAPT